MSPVFGDLSCAVVERGGAVRWQGHWRNHISVVEIWRRERPHNFLEQSRLAPRPLPHPLHRDNVLLAGIGPKQALGCSVSPDAGADWAAAKRAEPPCQCGRFNEQSRTMLTN